MGSRTFRGISEFNEVESKFNTGELAELACLQSTQNDVLDWMVLELRLTASPQARVSGPPTTPVD